MDCFGLPSADAFQFRHHCGFGFRYGQHLNGGRQRLKTLSQGRILRRRGGHLFALHTLEEGDQGKGEILDTGQLDRRRRALKIRQRPENHIIQGLDTLLSWCALQFKECSLDLPDPFQGLEGEEPEDLFLEFIFDGVRGHRFSRRSG